VSFSLNSFEDTLPRIVPGIVNALTPRQYQESKMSTMKSTATNPKSNSKADKAARAAVIQCDTSPGQDSQFDYIATAAYYKAEARQFAPGQELDDWLLAEQDFKG
jgi:Protein of unknown function (DUF2934)